MSQLMLSLGRPLDRIPFVFGVTAANSAILLAVLLSFAFLPTGAGHIAVMIVVGALMWWWFALHARRFASAGQGIGWPVMAGLTCFLTFAVSYAIIAALWSVPEVQQEAFRTGGSDYTKHIETSAALVGFGRWMTGWVGAASSVVIAGLLATLMSLVALASGVFSFVAMLLPNRSSATFAPFGDPKRVR
ncbi:MAG: hypothetical protein ACRCTI_17405 [Beijerinckiaceae bacterium]